MNQIVTQEQAQNLNDLYEQYLLEPCKSKEELNQWIQTYLGINFPNYTLDENSTSNPLDFIWDVYSAVLYADAARTTFVGAASRAGCKCLAEGTLVATPTGPKPIEQMKPGDTVYNEYGKRAKVTAVHDQGMQECVNLMHHNTVLATCTPNHIWQCFDERRRDKWRDMKVEDFYNGVRIRRVEVEQPLGKVNEPLAYTLGALIGDGSCNECSLCISSIDSKIPDRVASVLGTYAKKVNTNNYTYIIRAPRRGVKWHFSDFYEKYLRGKLAHTKQALLHEIKKWNRESLMQFIAGLLDTDGSVSLEKQGKLITIRIGMQCEDAIRAFAYALETIWQVPRARVYRRSTYGAKGSRKYKNGDLFICSLSSNYFCKKILKDLDPFLVSPQKKWKPEYELLEPNNFSPDGFGVRVEPAGVKHCYDITVDTPTSLYLLQNGMVTHNTLSVSVLEFLLMLHFGKTIVHLSAILDQSMACINYLDNFLALPSVKKYSKTDSQRKKILRGLPPSKYRQHIPASLRVLVATKESANGMRGNVLCVPGTTEILVKPWQEEQRNATGCVAITAKEIYDRIESGQEVVAQTVNEQTLRLEFKPVVKAYKRKETKRVRITTSAGNSVAVTYEHPVAVDHDGSSLVYLEAGSLSLCNNMYTKDSETDSIKKVSIVNIESVTGCDDPWVYDFEVQDNHNFIGNGHILHNCFDETDLIDPSILSEAAMIADPDQLGRPPIFIYISSRKSAFGPVQDKIDASNNPENGIRLHKWSLCDFMRQCPPSVHLPDEPKHTVYIHRDSLEIKSHEEFVACPETVQLGFDPKEVFAGCVSCSALLVCQGRAVNQKSQESKALRDIAFVKTVLRETKDPEKIKAQLLNLKPESSGNVFNRMDRARNTGTIHQAWEYAFSVPLDPEVKISKRQLMDALRANEWFVTCGVDFGYVDPAVSTLVAYHRAFDKLLIVHTIKAPGFSNPDWLAYTKERIYVPYGFNLLCPDTADKSAPTTAAKLGMQSRSRKPHRIEAGVSFLRNHIWSPTQQKTNLFIIDDEFNASMISSLERYQYKRGPEGFVFDVYDPDSPWSHEIDALRYACDPWVVYGKSQVSADQPKQQIGVPLYFEHQKAKEEALKQEKKYLMSEIRQHYSDEYRLALDIPEEPVDNETEGSPTLFFSF